MPRVLLLVVDGCTSRLLGPALDSGALPTLTELSRRGRMDLDCVSIFPSITPAATASIVTGQYPDRHGIAGMSWWNPATGDVSYFGDDVRTVLERGAGEFLRDFMLHLNGDRLQAPTIFQVAERHSLRAACFNQLIFKGDVPHTVTAPWLLRLWPSMESELTVHGPSWLCLGDFIATTGRHDVEAPGGVFNRFGLDDEGTEAFLCDVPGADAMADVSVAYFADYDFDSHDRGPEASLDTLRRLDARLRHIFDAWGGIDRVLEHLCIVMTADHSHSEVDRRQPAIDLRDALDGFRCAEPGAGWKEEDDLMLCPNMRAAELFFRRPGRLQDACDALLQEPGVDQVIWREERDERDVFRVRTRDRGTLRFRRAAGEEGIRDDYGARWEVRGDEGALDLTVHGGRIGYGEYPNALERIACGVVHPGTGRVWVTARPGREFQLAGQSPHPGAGSHGTLHALDSLVPLLVSGAGAPPRPDVTPRIVDAAAVCAAAVGLAFPVKPGESRA